MSFSKNNRSLRLLPEEECELKNKLVSKFETPLDQLVAQADCLELELPENFFDLLILDPPYNLTKKFGSSVFSKKDSSSYQSWFEDVLTRLLPALKKTASVYVCADWKTSSAIIPVLEEHLIVRNRITWEREKGRAATRNWKQCSEDIWFCTVSNEYFFDYEAVKLKKSVIAPYRDKSGKPKDWFEDKKGQFRLTAASNLWTDISVPFWSMPENTEHPTQKPEKLVSKLLLASSKEDDFVLDPFAGSGTTGVVCRKLGRRCFSIEKETSYALLAQKRLSLAEAGGSIQGLVDGVFLERNAKVI